MYDTQLEETMAPQTGSLVAADIFDNSNVQTEVSPNSLKSRPSTPELKNPFWVPGIENMQLFNFDFDKLSSSPSSNRSLSPPRSSSPPTDQGIQTHPCPPMSMQFKFSFPFAKEKETEPTPASVGRRIATPKSKKKLAVELIDDNASTDSSSTSSSTLLNGDDQPLDDVIIDDMEESYLAAAFSKMFGLTNTRDLNLKHEMRLKIEALMNELIDMERDANTSEVEAVDQ